MGAGLRQVVRALSARHEENGNALDLHAGERAGVLTFCPSLLATAPPPSRDAAIAAPGA